MRIPSILIIAVLLAAPPANAAQETVPGAPLADLLTALLEQGDTENIPRDHPLRPVAEVPSIATLSYLLHGDDPLSAARLYPHLTQFVSALFSPPHANSAGFITGERLGGGALAQPGLNALAALELHSLSLVAAAAGHRHDAIELRDWSYRHADALRRLFFDPASGTFRAPAGTDSFSSGHDPDQLLPFLVGRKIGTRALCAAVELVGHQGRSRRPRLEGASLWDDPAVRPIIVSLLSGLDAPACKDPLALLAVAAPPSDRRTGSSPHADWLAFWTSAGDALRRLRPPADDIFVLTQFALVLEQKDLLEPGLREPFAADLAFLTACLESDTVDLDLHVEAMEAADRLMAAVSDMARDLELRPYAWRIFSERAWAGMSPRERRITAEACRLASADLAAARRTVTARMLRTTGISASFIPPARPVRAGEPVSLEVSLRSESAPLAIELVSLRAEKKRWLLGGVEEPLILEPGTPPLLWTRYLPAAQQQEPGLHTLEVGLEFVVATRRVELYLLESFLLAPKYDVALHFPRGRTISRETLPVEIVVKHQSDAHVCGSVSGLFTGDFTCEPRLPAEFHIHADDEITILPLEIAAGAAAGPGRHPFTLKVTLGDVPIAVFDETLVRPLRWLHLGPLPRGDWLARSAVDLSGNLAAEHTLPDGSVARWREVPAAALNADGAVAPELLYGPAHERGMLLYAAVSSPRPGSYSWRIAGGCTAEIWVNGLPLATGHAQDAFRDLRAGRNSILVASQWNSPCAAILIEILDEGGLPPAELRDATGSALRDASRYAATPADAPPHPEQPREVFFTLAHPQAREVSLIGEFNGWAPEAAPMRLVGEGLWRTSVLLTPGTYSYKFLVDRRQRIVDPQALRIEADGFGGHNAVITIE